MQILFFATAEDIKPILSLIESKFPIQYYETGLFDSRDRPVINAVSEIDGFGVTEYGDWNQDSRLMALPQDVPLIVREISQKKGGVKYAIDPLENKVSICFQFGGIYQEGVIVAGSCGSAFKSDFSVLLFREFSRQMKSHFKKIDNFYVGIKAESKLRLGWRLVTNDKLSKDFDLKLK